MAVNLQQLEKEGVYQGKSPLVSLLSDLDQIEAFTRDMAARKRRRAKIGGIVILAGIILAVIGAVTGLAFLLSLAVLAIVGGILQWFLSFGKGRVPAHPKRLEIARERLTMIQPDAKAEKPFSLRLALRSQPVRLSEEAWHGRKNGRQELFEEPWLSLQGPLLDGTVLTDEIKELSRKRTFSNARGKRKTKARLTFVVSVCFSYPKERYGDARPAQQALKEGVKVGPAATLRCVRVTDKAVTLKAVVTLNQEIARTTGVLSMGGYRILNLARRMMERQRGIAR